MMSNHLYLLVFLSATLPDVMAIHCYDCLPGPSGNLCTEMAFINATDCEEADACAKVAFEIRFGLGGRHKLKMNALQCAVKSMCGTMKERACNGTVWQEMGMNLTHCDLNCCTQDKCNCPHPPCGPTILPWLQRLWPIN